MFLEGEVNWILVLGVLAGVMTLLAAWSTWFALTHRETVVAKSGQLDVVQKVAESADKRLFETLNAIPVAIVETDTQGKFVFANRAAHQLLGRRDAELIGLRFHSATWGITFPDGRTIPPDMLPSARALRGRRSGDSSTSWPIPRHGGRCWSRSPPCRSRTSGARSSAPPPRSSRPRA